MPEREKGFHWLLLWGAIPGISQLHTPCVCLHMALPHNIVWEGAEDLGCKLEMLADLWPAWHPPFVHLSPGSVPSGAIFIFPTPPLNLS